MKCWKTWQVVGDAIKYLPSRNAKLNDFLVCQWKFFLFNRFSKYFNIFPTTKYSSNIITENSAKFRTQFSISDNSSGKYGNGDRADRYPCLFMIGYWAEIFLYEFPSISTCCFILFLNISPFICLKFALYWDFGFGSGFCLSSRLCGAFVKISANFCNFENGANFYS